MVNGITRKIGLTGEKAAFDMLAAKNFEPKFVPDFNAESHDLMVGSLPVEVKYANTTYRLGRVNRAGQRPLQPRWQFFIHPTRPTKPDWILLLIANDGDRLFWYVLPGPIVGERSHLQLTRHPLEYTGWLAQWQDRWEIITYLQNGVYRNNGPLLDEWQAQNVIHS